MADKPQGTPKTRAMDRDFVMTEEEAEVKLAAKKAEKEAETEEKKPEQKAKEPPREEEGESHANERERIIQAARDNIRKKRASAPPEDDDAEEDPEIKPEKAEKPPDEDLGDGLLRRDGVVGMELTVAGKKVFKALSEIKKDEQKLLFASQEMSKVNSREQEIAKREREVKALEERFLAQDRDKNAERDSPKTEKKMKADAAARAKKAAEIMVSGTVEEMEQELLEWVGDNEGLDEIRSQLQEVKKSLDVESLKADIRAELAQEEDERIGRAWVNAGNHQLLPDEDGEMVALRSTLANMMKSNEVLLKEFENAIDDAREDRKAEGGDTSFSIGLLNDAAKRTLVKYPWIATGISDDRQNADKESSARRMVKPRSGPARTPAPQPKTLAEARASRAAAIIASRAKMR